jgi:hypothetical protein
MNLHTMSDDDLFNNLGLGDMDDDERRGFLTYMRAWSNIATPSPTIWWAHGVAAAAIWRRQNERHVDQLIAEALGTQ